MHHAFPNIQYSLILLIPIMNESNKYNKFTDNQLLTNVFRF